MEIYKMSWVGLALASISAVAVATSTLCPFLPWARTSDHEHVF